MKFSSIAVAFQLAQAILAAPVVITRQHTADAVTVTDTYSTTTNTHTAPTVEILVSDGATYTYTLTDATVTEATTFTSYINKDNDPATNSPTTTLAPSNTPEGDNNSSTDNNDNNNGGDNQSTSATSSAAQTTDNSNDNSNNNDNNNQQVSSTAAQASSSAQQAPTTSTSSDAQTFDAQTSDAQTSDAQTSDAPSSTTSDEQTTSSSSTSSTSSATSTGSSGSVPSAIVYSPYNNDGTCKENDDVKSDLQKISDVGIKSIRIYGTDCNSIQTVLPNAASLGLKVNQGFWISSSGASSISDSVQDIIDYAKDNSWDVFDFLTIGNEAVQSGYISVSDLKSLITSTKSKLQSNGYNGKVTTAEPPVTFQENPDLCSAEVDFLGIQPHPYFDQNSSAKTSGTFVKGQVDLIKKVCGSDKTIVVTETGYPHKGNQNGGNIPSEANQKIAVEAILKELDNQITLLSTFDDYWKQPGTYGIEQSFGALSIFQ